MSGSTKRYPAELRERAVRMVAEVRHEHSSEWAAVESVAGKLGVGTPQTLPNWVRRGQIVTGVAAVALSTLLYRHFRASTYH